MEVGQAQTSILQSDDARIRDVRIEVGQVSVCDHFTPAELVATVHAGGVPEPTGAKNQGDPRA